MTQPYDERPAEPAQAQEPPVPEGPADEPGTSVAPDAQAPDLDAPDAPAEAVPPRDREEFGDPRVDDAVARLEELTERPVGEHAEVFDDIHQRLRDALEEAAVEPADEPRG